MQPDGTNLWEDDGYEADQVAEQPDHTQGEEANLVQQFSWIDSPRVNQPTLKMLWQLEVTLSNLSLIM